MLPDFDQALRIVVEVFMHVLDGDDRLHLVQAILWHFVREAIQMYLDVLCAAHGMRRDLTFPPERPGLFRLVPIRLAPSNQISRLS